MAKKKKQLWRNADPRMDQIREEHILLGRQLWQRGKYRRGNAVKPAVTLASQALKVELREKNLARWLNIEAEAVFKFYRPLWWLNPVKWFKAHDMRKRRDLCTYMLTAPHMSHMLFKRSKPVTLLSTKWLLRPLLNLTKRFSRWFQRISKRESFREKVSTFRKEDAKRRRVERLKKQDLQRQMRECDERTAKIKQEMAENEEKHRKAMEESAKERADKKRAHEERMGEWDKKIEQKKIVHEERMGEWDKKIEQKKIAHEERMREIDRKSRLEEIKSTKEHEMRLKKMREESQQFRSEMREMDALSSRRLRELQPTIARLKAMMAAVWICQVSGKSTIARMAAVIAEHDRIAARNGLTRKGFDNYCYQIFRDTRRYDGVELEDRLAASQGEEDLRIRKASSRGFIRI